MSRLKIFSVICAIILAWSNLFASVQEETKKKPTNEEIQKEWARLALEHFPFSRGEDIKNIWGFNSRSQYRFAKINQLVKALRRYCISPENPNNYALIFSNTSDQEYQFIRELEARQIDKIDELAKEWSASNTKSFACFMQNIAVQDANRLNGDGWILFKNRLEEMID